MQQNTNIKKHVKQISNLILDLNVKNIITKCKKISLTINPILSGKAEFIQQTNAPTSKKTPEFEDKTQNQETKKTNL